MQHPKLRVLEAGHCVHPEHIILRNRNFKPVRLPASFAVIEHPREGLTLYDTGYSERFFEITRKFPERLYAMITPATLHKGASALEQLAAFGYQASDVRHVIISHFHADHISALRDFPHATLHSLANAWHHIRDLSKFKALTKGVLLGMIPPDIEARLQLVDQLPSKPLPAACAPLTHGFDILGDGSVLGVSLPGHMHGQMGLLIHADDNQLYLFVADACWASKSYREMIMPHPITRLLFDDFSAYRHTLQDLHTLHLANPSLHIIPSHCEEVLARLRASTP